MSIRSRQWNVCTLWRHGYVILCHKSKQLCVFLNGSAILRSMQHMPGHELKTRPRTFSEGNGETSQHHSWQLPQHQVMNTRQRFVALGPQTLCAVSFAITFDHDKGCDMIISCIMYIYMYIYGYIPKGESMSLCLKRSLPHSR